MKGRRRSSRPTRARLTCPPEVKDAVLARMRETCVQPLPRSARQQRCAGAIAKHWGVQVAKRAVRQRRRRAALRYHGRLGRTGPQACSTSRRPSRSTRRTPSSRAREVVNMPARRRRLFTSTSTGPSSAFPQGDIDVVVLTSPNNPTGMTTRCRRHQAHLGRERRARPGRRGLRRIFRGRLPRAARRVREPHHLAHFLQGVPLRRGAPGLLPRQPARSSTSSRRCASRTPSTRSARSCAEEVMAHARRCSKTASRRRSANASVCLSPRWTRMDGRARVPERGQLHPVPACSGATGVWERPAPAAFRAGAQRVRRARAWPGCLRVSIGTPEENDAFLAALDDVLKNWALG